MKLLERSKVKNYLRIDGEYDDEMLENTLMPAAEAYLYGAVDRLEEKLSDPKLKKQAELIGMVLVGEFYDNRELIDNRKRQPSYTVQSMIAQLQLAKPVIAP